MRKILESQAIRLVCLFLGVTYFFMTAFPCFADTNISKINSLLQEIYNETPTKRSHETDIKNIINYRLRIARERNYSSNLKSSDPLFVNAVSKQDVFGKIYDKNYWGSLESRSGSGSKMDATQNIRESLPKIWGKYGVKSVLDVPCGDYNWMKTIDKKNIQYIGGDIVPEIVRTNNKNFKNDNTSFEVIDITSDKIPKADMIICRDCLQHLSYENVKKALKNFKESGSTYLLATSYPWTLDNWDILDGDYRPLNLLQKPFNFQPSYLEKIQETNISWNEPDKFLYLYKLDDINPENFDSGKKSNTTVPIAMAMDEGYLYPTIVSITSIMENSNYKTKYDFYVMHPRELSESSKSKLKTLQEKYENCNINLINMGNKYKDADCSYRGHITTPAYYRLSLSDLLPELDKIIWLDGDTLIFKDLREMLDIDMEGYYYKGFLDCEVNGAKMFGINNDHYICSGVMVVNLKELRKDNATEKFKKFIKENNHRLVQHDQTVINVVCYEKTGILPAKFGIWNCFSQDLAANYPNTLLSPEKYTFQELINAWNNPVILHCCWSKPWRDLNWGNTVDLWWHYAKETDFFDEIQRKYLIPNGTYEIVSEIDSRKALDISKASKEQGAELQIWDRNHTDAQKFNIKYDKNGLFTIQAKCSGKMIDVPGSVKKESTPLWQYENNNTDAQKWYILPNGDGSYRIISKCNGMCVDVRRSNTKNSTPIQCYNGNGTKAQKFRFERC